MTAAAASHNCVSLSYMSRLIDFAVSNCFLGKIFSFDDTFEERELILGQKTYPYNYSCCNKIPTDLPTIEKKGRVRGNKNISKVGPMDRYSQVI